MKLMFASDIHGSKFWCEKLEERFLEEKADRLVLLGDLLYHGPRNDLPKEHDPKAVIGILNKYKNQILAVRGNCDSEVDQMVLEFPMLADYLPIFVDGITLFCTHGHLFGKENPPPVCGKTVLLNGHTHVYQDVQLENFRYINIGSVALPKENKTNTYAVYQDGEFLIKDFDGNIVE